MSFNTPLSGGNYTTVRGKRWQGNQFVSFNPQTVVLACRAAEDMTAGDSHAQVSYDTVTAGSYTAVKPGWVVLISPDSDKSHAKRYRVRAAPSSSVIYLNEMSDPVTTGDYIWVIKQRDITDKLARPSADGQTQYKDYNLGYHVPYPVVSGLQSSYAGWIDSGTSKLRLTLSAGNSFATNAAISSTISTYQYTFESATVISGSLSTYAVTVDVPEGFQEGQLQITDAAGSSWTMYFEIHAHGDTYQPALAVDSVQISGDWQNGYNASITCHDPAELSGILNNTRCTIWRDEWYNDVHTSVAANNIDFVGYWKSESNSTQADATYSQVKATTFQVQGFAARLARLEQLNLTLRESASPSVWDEILYLTPWRAAIHALQQSTTLLECACLFSDDIGTTWRYPQFPVQGGNPLSAVQGILNPLWALEFGPAGNVQITRDIRYANATIRNMYSTIANWDNRDYVGSLSLDINQDNDIGKVEAAGGFGTTATNEITVVKALAPGIAQAAGQGTASLNNVILTVDQQLATAQNELRTIAGYHLSVSNTQVRVGITAPDGYHFLVPSRNQRYTWTLTANDTAHGIAYTTSTYWLLENVSISHNNETGARDVKYTYLLEASEGSPGYNVPPVTESEVPTVDLAMPALDPFPALPDDWTAYIPDVGYLPEQVPQDLLQAPPQQVARQGDAAIITDGSSVKLLTNIITLTTPKSRDVTPTLAANYSPKWVCFGNHGTTDKSAYVLASDGTNSRVYYTSDVFAGVPDWVEGTAYSGVYTDVEPTSSTIGVMIYGASGTAYVDNLTTGLGPKTHLNSASYGMGVWPPYSTSGTYIATGGRTGGGRMQCAYSSTQGGLRKGEAVLVVDLGAEYTVTAASSWHVQSNSSDVCTSWITFWDGTKTNVGGGGSGALGCSTTWRQFNYSGSSVANVRYISFASENNIDFNDTFLDDISVTYGGAGSNVRYSSNNGSTFGSPVSIGNPPGAVGGFGVQFFSGTVSYGSALNATYKASTSGGAYSSFKTYTNASPVSIVIPARLWASDASTNYGSSPDVLIGLSASSGGALKRTTGAGVETDITPTAGAVVDHPGALTTWKGSRIAGNFNVSGTHKLYTTTNKGGAWTLRQSLSGSATMVRGMKYDRFGNVLFALDGSTLYYGKWAGTGALSPRHLPISAICMDIWG